MPDLEEYIAHWNNKYNLTIIFANVNLTTGLEVSFKLTNQHLTLLKKYNQSDYNRFKIQAEMYVKKQMPAAFPKLQSCQITNNTLILSGAPAVINVFLELLFNPCASGD